LLLIFLIVGIHLIQVNFIDSIITDWIGHDYANEIFSLEGNFVFSFSQSWLDFLVYFFVFIYIVLYPFTLWFSPLYFILIDNKKAMKTLAYGLLLIYIIALPFYLFLPVTNVYCFFNANSALESVIPSVDNFFYSTTTQNNCLPSLHTAMTILIAYSVSLTKNRRYSYLSFFTMFMVIISVIYLSIHWISDVITGAALSIGVILILKRYIHGNERNE